MFASKDVFLTPPATGGYTISRSVRLRSSASAYFNRTFGTPTNNLKWAWSGWVKRGKLGVTASLLDATPDAYAFNWANFYFTTADKLQFEQYSTGYNVRVITDAVFRDPSAWYHIFFIYDSANATANDRVQIWVNGVRQSVTYLTGPFAINTASKINVNGTVHREGVYSTDYADCYLADTYFIDGQTVTSSSFGETNAVTGVWQPKKYAGTYGANGSYLNFSDNSNNTAATIGKDYSGNGNNWTPNNISVTAGTTYDSMTDVPTLTSATVANYCVLNPLQLATPVVSYSLSNGNLQMDTNAGSTYNCFANGTIFPTTGKWYAEFTQIGGTRVFAGISRFTNIASPNSWNASSTYYINTGEIQKDGSTVVTGATYTTGDVIGVAYDADNTTCAFYKNNSLQTTVTGVTAGTYSFSVNGYQSGSIAVNFGQRPFTYTPPTGFVALNTYNLPTSTITNGAAYMAASLYTGTNANLTVTNTVNGTGMQPDLVWMKIRSTSASHVLIDSVRGVTKTVNSDLTNAESTSTGTSGLLSFNSNGFSLGTDSSATGSTNGNGNTYVGWQWKAGTTSSSNTNGSITSTVSVGATQGFSVVTYTGTGANATVGHGLGVAPSMVIVKSRSINPSSWSVYTSMTGAGNELLLNSTAASSASANSWNSTSPTSSVFSVGTAASTNQSSATYVAYCFAAVKGFSAFGSYTGNGSTDGPFVYLGFRPRFVLVKQTDAVGNWIIWDTSRSTYNQMQDYLLTNSSQAESNNVLVSIDVLSNGFKCRTADDDINGNGNSYIFAAFAESPFKYSRGR
jgi:hypothetical protein